MWNVLLAAVLLAGPADFEAQTLDGQSVVGQISQLTAQQLVLETADGEKIYPIGSLAAVSRRKAPQAAGPKTSLWLELVDQSGLAAVDFTVRGSAAKVGLAGGATLEVPTRLIRWVRFAAPGADDKLAAQWSGIIDTKAAGDLLVVHKEGALDYLEGVQGDIDDQTCHFELDKEKIPVKRPKVEGVIYFHPVAAQMPEAIGQLMTAEGSRLAMRSVELAAGSLQITTPGGIVLTVPLDAVTRFDFSSGKIAYLSDLAVETAKYVPFFGFKEQPPALAEFYQFRRDVSFEQSPLKLDGKVYRKGLSLQSRTVLAYRLPARFRLFKAVVGIDDSVREAGDVRLEIKGDGRVLWQGDVRGSDAARELELEIAGVKRLEIIVDYGADLDIGDRLDLCDARVTK